MKTIKTTLAILMLTAMPVGTPGAVRAAAALPALRICTGDPKFRYFQTGIDVAKQLQGTVKVDVVPTEGSIDNLRKMASGDCDAAIVQGDSYLVYSAGNPMAQLHFVDVGPMYPEYPHLVCNRDAGIRTVSDLLKKPDTKVAIGAVGSGAETTWEALTLKKPDYRKVSTVPLPSDLALTGIKNGRDAQCALIVAGLRSKYMTEVSDLGKNKLTLVGFDEPSLTEVKDAAGRQVYRSAPIPGGTYRNLQDGGWFSGSKDTPAVSIDSEFVVNQSWYDANRPAYGTLSTTVLRLGQQLAAKG